MEVIDFFLENVARDFSAIVGYIALGIIVIGLTVSFFHLITLLFQNKKKFHENLNNIRIRLGRFLLLALEFLIAKDIMLTIFDPNFEDLLMLGIIIVIRVILSFFLHRELKEIKLHK